MKRSPLLLLLTPFVVIAATSWNCRSATSSPTAGARPIDACAAALASAPVRDDRDREIARLQDQARSAMDRERALVQLGYRYVARARARGDEGDYTLAEQAALCMLGSQPEHESAMLLRGHVLHQMHRFEEAEPVARRLIAKRQFVLDYGLLGDVLMEQGRLTEAANAYQKMIDLKPFYQSYTRAAHLRWLKGDVDGARRLMRMAVGAASPRDPEAIAWAYTRLAHYEMQSGRLDEASVAVDAALTHQEEYAAALLVRGRLLLARSRHAEAIAPLERAVALSPLPEYQWALADALRLVDREEDARALERDLTTNGPRTDPRTVALFLATRGTSPAAAVVLAEQEMRTRSDVFTLDALAWALAASGRTEDARPLMTRALAEGTQDARLFMHAAAIAAAAGDRDETHRWLDQAERLRTMLLPSELETLASIQPGTSTTEEN